MLAEYKKTSNVKAAVGIVLQIIGRGMLESSPLFATLAILLGSASFVWGCADYSKGKGYHWGWGFLGFLSLPGLLVLYFLRDKHQ